jgi:hypothetical protein
LQSRKVTSTRHSVKAIHQTVECARKKNALFATPSRRNLEKTNMNIWEPDQLMMDKCFSKLPFNKEA